MRVAAVYATDVARACGEWAHLVAGTSSIREGSRLERAFRDIYTGTQHAFISEKVAIDAAQIWLGISRTSPGDNRVQETRSSCSLRLASTSSMCASAHTFTPHITCWRDRPRSVSS